MGKKGKDGRGKEMRIAARGIRKFVSGSRKSKKKEKSNLRRILG